MALLASAVLFLPWQAHPESAPQSKSRLPRPTQIDRGIAWQRDPANSQLRPIFPERRKGTAAKVSPPETEAPASIRVVTEIVSVTCTAFTAQGDPLLGLHRDDFRVFDNGAEQPISYFDAATQSASVAIVIDASPSVLRDTDEMKRAADALIDALAPLDQAAVVDFSAHTYVQAPFSDVRELTRRALARVDPRALLADAGGSNIYQAVYLAAWDLFAGRQGRKAMVVLTDGQDSGLGLTLDPASASPRPGTADNRLTFEDVTRFLADNDIQVFAVSTENRPKIMTPAWLASHASTTLLAPRASDSGIPPYTLYLAELVRRAGGQLFFLREKQTMADTFREIARKIRAEYTLGFYPTVGSAAMGWHELRVELPAQAHATVSHRSSYYVPALD